MNLRTRPDATTALTTGVELATGVRWPLVIRKGSPSSYRLMLGDGVILLDSPRGQYGEAESAFLGEKLRWLRRHYQVHARFQQERSRLRAHRTDRARLFGREVPITFVTGPKLFYRFDGQALTVILTERWARRPDERLRVVTAVLRRLATDYLTRRTRQMADLVGVTVHDIRVKGHRSKWGSCSWQGNLNLNWYLLLLPREVSDYVILHELMHRHEMNHSARYWAHVGRWLPDYRKVIQRLRADEWVLGLYEGS